MLANEDMARVESEAGIIATLIHHPDFSYYSEQLLPNHFTNEENRYIYQAICSLARDGIERIDPYNIKVDEGWWLGCLPRSGLGFKYRLQLDNTMGVIDSDYYYSDNEGHIFAKITNDNHTGKTLTVEAGSGFLQAIFIPYGVTYSDDATGVRNGGMGSTDSKS